MSKEFILFAGLIVFVIFMTGSYIFFRLEFGKKM